MPKKGIFRRAVDAVIAPFRRKKTTPPTPSAPAPAPAPTPTPVPPKPEIPPHPRRVPPSTLSVDDRVAQFKSLSRKQRREMRPQDEDSEFWRLYDGGGA